MPKHVRVGTFHSFGLSTIGRVYPNVFKNINQYKTRDILAGMQVEEQLHSFISKLVSMAKNQALGLHGDISDSREWYQIIDKYDLTSDLENPEDENLGVEACIGIAKKVLKLSNDMVAESHVIDYDDMIYYPVVKGMRMWQYDWVIGDEMQDANKARHAMVRLMMKSNGRGLFVGDRHQAIYGFTGADTESVENIIKDFNCKLFPLSVTFRCPKAVVKVCQTVFPHINAHETAPEGQVVTIYNNELFTQNFNDTDVIICRKTKPLVETAFALIRKGVPCRVEGKDIGKGLLNLVNRWKVKSIDVLKDRLKKYLERETSKLIAKGNDVGAQNLQDRIETIYVLMEGCPDVDCIRDKISKMFKDSATENKKMLTLSTIHKCKAIS